MRSPENVLESLKSKACNKSYKYERLYRNLYNPQFYLLAYQRIQAKPGNMTAGTDGKTIDGMGMARINALIEKMRDFSYQPNPARRTYIPKSNGKMRPLGIPSFDDKLIQEVVRLILESIYEPTFSDYSHGFRINRSCHTALKYVQKYFTGTKWFVEGDIKGCFDNVDHHVLIAILRKRIADEHFIGLLWKFLKAGYMEDWNYHNTYSGTPQGSIISPILANIYMNELDSYMAEYAEKFNCGNRRKINPAFKKKLDVCRGKEQRLMTVRPLPGGAMSGGNPRPRNSRRTGTMPFVSWPTTFICSASGKRTTHPKHRRKIHIPDSWRQSRKKTMWAICWIFSWRIPLMNKDCGLPNINQKSPIWKGE